MTKQPRILVRSPNWIGDHVMAIPFYRGLKEIYPEAELTLLCPEALAGLDVGGVFSRTMAFSPKERSFFRGAWALGKRLRHESFDLAITLPASWSAAIVLWAARIPVRIGFRGDGSDLFLTDSVRWPGRAGGLHKSELYLELLQWFSAASGVKAAAPLAPSSRREKLIVVAPGASIALREWPYFPELLLDLRKTHPDFRIVVVGGPREKKWHSQLKRWGEGIEDCVEATSLEDLRRLMSTASLVIANDSGLAHVGATLAAAPTIVLLGPGDPDYVLPKGPKVFGLRVSLPCSPCESAICRAPFGYQKCLRALPVERVLATAHQALHETKSI